MKKLPAVIAVALLAAAALSQTQTPLPKSTETRKPSTTDAQAAPQQPVTPPPFVDPSTVRPKARPEDVKSVDAIIAALYDVISGPAGPRDWDRMKSLMLPDARFMPVGHRPDGQDVYRAIDADGYVQRATPAFLREGFFETGIANRVEQFGNIAHVFSTYESRHEKGGEPFAKGINSIQLVKLGDRWWVASIMWDTERPGVPIPEKYQKSDSK
jgi:hypothetical protein